MPGEQIFFFLTVFPHCATVWYQILPLNATFVFIFGNDAPPIESCIHVSCKKLCFLSFVLFAVVFFSCLFWRCASGLSSHLDHNFLLPVDLSVIFWFE